MELRHVELFQDALLAVEWCLLGKLSTNRFIHTNYQEREKRNEHCQQGVLDNVMARRLPSRLLTLMPSSIVVRMASHSQDHPCARQIGAKHSVPRCFDKLNRKLSFL
jgi:hypothetical protein